jgi:CubicO group peptidase (beta-lactamase class C family)
MVTGKSLSHLLEEVLWQPMGMERDGYIWLDRAATEMAGGGLNVTARDAARFGQMIIQQGYFNGRQIIPNSVPPGSCNQEIPRFSRATTTIRGTATWPMLIMTSGGLSTMPTRLSVLSAFTGNIFTWTAP